MADITKCTYTECPMADTCYRIQAKSNPLWQSCSDYSYHCNADSGFDEYIRNEVNDYECNQERCNRSTIR